MTDGRFETIFNCRPKGWDDRNFWTKHREQEYQCQQDHMQRESCPFHDLRASGCFQPEYWGPGMGGKVIGPDQLCHRKGSKMPFVTNCGRVNDHTGVAGLQFLHDTDPGRWTYFPLRSYDARPWTSTRKITDMFSKPPYMTVPPPDKIVPPVEPPFRTSKVNEAYTSYPHVAAEGKKVTAERPAFRLKAGKVPFRLDPRLKFEPGAEAGAKTKKPRRKIERSPYVAAKNLHGTFSQFPKYLPVPYEEPSIKTDRRPIFTWFTHTKRCMPVNVPWGQATHCKVDTKGLKQRPSSAANVQKYEDVRFASSPVKNAAVSKLGSSALKQRPQSAAC